MTIPQFDHQLKRLVKKYPSFKNNFISFLQSLCQLPQHGTPLGKSCYKIRLAIAAMGKGKSDGARVITNIVIDEATVYLLTIYDKSEKNNLSDKELEELLKYIPV